MAGEIAVVFTHGASGDVVAHFRQTSVVVDGSEIGAAHRAVAIKQFPRAKGGAIIVFVGRRFQVADGFVEAIFLPQMQCGIQPRRRIIGIQFFG